MRVTLGVLYVLLTLVVAGLVGPLAIAPNPPIRGRSAARPAKNSAVPSREQVPPASSQTLPPGVWQKTSLGDITEYEYPNGLRVLLYPDPSDRAVTVNMTYLVGSRFEGYGESGMAHLLEHMTFIRSTHDRDIKKELTDHGAQWNGTTSYDRTNYFETVTAGDDNLRWALGLEAERMVNMRIEFGLLATEMTVVRNEFERGENDPENVLQERVLSTAYLWHNYGKSVIGSRADLERIPAERLAAFYRKYYQPDNAALVIAGQFDVTRALAAVADTVGMIPRPTRTLDATYTVEPTQDGERYVELHRVGVNRALVAAWHAPAMAHSDAAALEVLAAVMVNGRGGGAVTGRLYKALVEGKKAISVRMFCQDLHDPGVVIAAATLGGGHSLDVVRTTMMKTIAGVVTNPPTDEEITRARTGLLQAIVNRTTRGMALDLTETIAAGDWRLLLVHYDQIRSVTSDDVVRVAARYFKPSNRTVGVFIPTPAPDRTEVPAALDFMTLFRRYGQTELTFSSGEAFDPTPANIEKRLTRVTLQSGMRLVMLPKRSTGGNVMATIQLRFGNDKLLAGLRTAGEMAGALLKWGTVAKTRQRLQDEMLKLNANITVTGGPTRAVATINTTDKNLTEALRLAVEMLRKPAFSEAEFDQVKQQRIAAIENSRTDPAALASLALRRAMNPFPRYDVRYVATIDEQLEDVKMVSLDDVRKFHSWFYGASHGEIAVVGQFSEADVQAALPGLLGSWSTPAPYQRIVTPYQKTTSVNLTIEIPDKQNAIFDAGIAFPMSDTDPDYAAMVLADYMFGGSTTARAPNRIRNREGLSYGVSSFFSAPVAGNAASLFGAASSNPANIPKVEASFRDELSKTVTAGFTAAELAAAKIALRDQRVLGRSQNAGLRNIIVAREEFGRTLAWDEQLEARIDALTVHEVNAAFRRHVNLEQLSIAKAGSFVEAGAYR